MKKQGRQRLENRYQNAVRCKALGQLQSVATYFFFREKEHRGSHCIENEQYRVQEASLSLA